MIDTPRPAPELLLEDELQMWRLGPDDKDVEILFSRLRESRNDNDGLRRSVQEALLQVSKLREELVEARGGAIKLRDIEERNKIDAFEQLEIAEARNKELLQRIKDLEDELRENQQPRMSWKDATS